MQPGRRAIPRLGRCQQIQERQTLRSLPQRAYRLAGTWQWRRLSQYPRYVVFPDRCLSSAQIVQPTTSIPGGPSRRSFLAATGTAFASSLAGWCVPFKGMLFAGYALVVIDQSSQISVVDLAAFALTGKLTFPDPIDSLLQDPERQTLLALAPTTGCVHFMDWPARRMQRTVTLASEARQMRLDPNAQALWISLSNPPIPSAPSSWEQPAGSPHYTPGAANFFRCRPLPGTPRRVARRGRHCHRA
jgi:hypothetical protein